jgi:UDP-N-acetylglucosamine--N-acetylmuramyl-(pentapeptide) pyrophosphoryl-undecaprenol N-acetylglucosamine transferase
MEADLVTRSGVPYTAIPAAGVHGVGWRVLPGNLLKLAQGTLAAGQILHQFKPEVMLFTGGYMAFPVAVAGAQIKSLLYVPDIEPGLALKSLAQFADCIAVTAEESRQYFPSRKKIVVTGYPVRPDINYWSRENARSHFGFDAQKPLLLVFGGSKGARSINRAVLAALPRLLEKIQVLHISGQLDWPEVQAAAAQLSPEQAEAYRPYAYLHDEMGAALAAADLAVSRAGASVLGEYPAVGLPAILVPYPYAWRYQKVNADFLTRRGAAILIEDAQLLEQLSQTVLALMNQPARLERMRSAMCSLAKPQAAKNIAGLVSELSAKKEAQL